MDTRTPEHLPRALDLSPTARAAPGIFRDMGAPARPCVGRRAPRTSQGRIHGRKGARMSFKFFSDEVSFREQTDRQARMAGVTGPSFRCVACKRVATTKGCKRLSIGSICAACKQAREQRRAGKGAA